MTEANRKAFLSVAARVTTAEGVAELSRLTDGQILNFIREVSVVSEKASDIRYIAVFNVRVNQDILTRYMQENNIPFVIGGAANILIIPTFREFKTDAPLLWEGTNACGKPGRPGRSKSERSEFSVFRPTGPTMPPSTRRKRCVWTVLLWIK